MGIKNMCMQCCQNRISIFLVLILLSAEPVFADTSTMLHEAIAHYRSGDLATAVKKFYYTLQHDPNNVAANYYLGIIHFNKGEAAKAVPFLEKLRQRPATIEGLEALLNSAYFQMGNYEKARPYFENEYRTNPGDEAVAYKYAQCLNGVEEQDAAMAVYREIISRNGAYEDAARYHLAKTLFRRGAYVSASEVFAKISLDSPYAGGAKSYIEALEPLTRPVSLYQALEVFYNDNPGASSSVLLGQGGDIIDSYGLTTVSLVKTRGYEWTDRLKAQLGYMFYGAFHTKSEARAYDFMGHYIKPYLRYYLNPAFGLELKVDLRFYDYNHQPLSQGKGVQLITTWKSQQRHTANLNVAYLRSNYTDSYESSGLKTSLEYMDTDKYSIGIGTTLFPEWGGDIMVDYTHNDAQAVREEDPRFKIKAKDGEYREHVGALNVTLPLRGFLSRFSLGAALTYSAKKYSNRQSGLRFPSVAGKHLTVNMLTWGANIKASIWEKAGMTLAFGTEATEARSTSMELAYENIRYYTKLTASY